MPAFHAIRIAAAITIIILIIMESTARELRPSDHGLEYQSQPPTGLKSPGMKSFFGAASKSSSSTPSTVALPKATNSNDTSWWGTANKRQGSDHVRHVLLLGSLVCGVTGVALLAATAFIYVIKIRSSRSTNSTTDTNNINSLVPISK
ncbi:hypothetical protein CRYUN_Cryun32bG0005900 [Craigia yunnanensis]